MKKKEIYYLINMEHLEAATKFVNENNTHLDQGVTQNEVLEVVAEHMGSELELFQSSLKQGSVVTPEPLTAMGMVFTPIVVNASEEVIAINLVTSVIPSFEFNEEDFELFTLTRKEEVEGE